MKRPAIVVACASALMSFAEPGDEFAGNSLEAVRSDGARAAAYFSEEGRVVFNGAYEQDRFTLPGTYSVQNGQFCMMLEDQSRDCWEYPEPLRVGIETTLKNVDGSLTARFKLLEGHTAKLPDPA